jgi:hypothetical protein
MRAVRRVDGKYVRNERIPDEAYRIDEDPGERTDLLAGGADEDDAELIADLEATLADFEDEFGGDWDEVETGDPLADADDDVKDRLQHLGYVE